MCCSIACCHLGPLRVGPVMQIKVNSALAFRTKCIWARTAGNRGAARLWLWLLDAGGICSMVIG